MVQTQSSKKVIDPKLLVLKVANPTINITGLNSIRDEHNFGGLCFYGDIFDFQGSTFDSLTPKKYMLVDYPEGRCSKAQKTNMYYGLSKRYSVSNIFVPISKYSLLNRKKNNLSVELQLHVTQERRTKQTTHIWPVISDIDLVKTLSNFNWLRSCFRAVDANKISIIIKDKDDISEAILLINEIKQSLCKRVSIDLDCSFEHVEQFLPTFSKLNLENILIRAEDFNKYLKEK